MNDDLIDALTVRDQPSPQGYADGPPLYVRVNHARWLVECPACAGAELASPKDCWFWCRSCFNADAGHQLLPVVWPEDAEAIARALRGRPTEAKNWLPGESLDALEADNIEHRVEMR